MSFLSILDHHTLLDPCPDGQGDPLPMIRIRGTDGKVTEVPAGHFVEICDVEGRPARIFHQDNNGVIRVMSPEDPDAVRYSALFKVPLARVIVLPETKGT